MELTVRLLLSWSIPHHNARSVQEAPVTGADRQRWAVSLNLTNTWLGNLMKDIPDSVPPAAGPPPAEASGAPPSAPSPSDRLLQPGAGPLPAQPPAAAASGLTARPGCGSSAESAHGPLTEAHNLQSVRFGGDVKRSLFGGIAVCQSHFTMTKMFSSSGVSSWHNSVIS